MDFEPSRRNVEMDITRAPESSRQEMERIMDQKMAVLRNQLEVSQNIAPPLEEQANTQTSLQAISEKLHNLQVCLKNLEVSREQDLQILREEMEDRITKAKKSWTKDCLIEMENKLENIVDIVDINITRALESTQQKAEKILSEKLTEFQNQLEVSQNVYREELISLESKLENIVDIVDINTTRALESTQQKAEKILSEKVAVLQNQLEVSQNVYREELILLENKLEFFIIQIYKVDISLDADTAHPRLEVSEDGKSVKDAGMIRKVPMREKRIDSHLFVLAKEGYTSGRFYWEVNVGKRRNWILGVAQESVTRKGTVALSPNNGFWVIGLVDGQEYWAYMDPWTHLAVTGTLQKIGIFLDISTKQLSFYNVHKKTILHAFTIADDSMQEGKLIPIFSTGSASAKTDLEPLSLV
nr:E3 ubiquitin-protein ligase TRIM39-like isoform X4 [Anas platyrhynchos]